MFLTRINIILFSTIITMISCSNNINIDKSVTSNTSAKVQYKVVNNGIKKFLKTYNDSLKAKVHKSFHNNFYFNNNNIFNIDIILSQKQHVLVYLEKSNQNKSNTYIYYSDQFPFKYIQELKNNNIFSIDTENNKFIYVIKGFAYFTNNNLVMSGISIPYVLYDSESIGVSQNMTLTLENGNEKIETKLTGTSILYATNETDDSKMFNKVANDLLNYEIRDLVLKSGDFKKAMAHPKLSKIAKQIKLKQDKSVKERLEYPQWQFEKDINEMIKIAKNNGLDNNYIDKILIDPQYTPISGKVLYYYGNKKQFMMQWILANLVLFIISYIMTILKIENINLFQIAFTFVAVALNGLFFAKTPDKIGLIYWIIPLLLFCSTILIFYFEKIVNAILKNNT